MRWRRTARRIVALAHAGSLRLSAGLADLLDDQFPMILPPETEDGLGVAVLNSSAEAHFSFTNALGLVSAEQTRRLSRGDGAISEGPLDHRTAPPSGGYPMPVKAFSERIGTALINGSWFVRRLEGTLGPGHRHARPSPYRLDRRLR